MAMTAYCPTGLAQRRRAAPSPPASPAAIEPVGTRPKPRDADRPFAFYTPRIALKGCR